MLQVAAGQIKMDEIGSDPSDHLVAQVIIITATLVTNHSTGIDGSHET